MKFAFILFKYFPFGGMQRDMLRTANTLVKLGHEVTIFTLSWQGEQPENVKVYLLPQRSWFNYQRYQKFITAAFEQINGSDYDYVFGYNRMAGLDAHFAADPCFVERMRKRNLFARLTPRYHWFAACEQAVFSSASSTEILAVSLTEKPHFQHWYSTQDARFHYIPPYLSAERFTLKPKEDARVYLRQTFGFEQSDFVYLLTGSGFAMKGLDRAILALAALPDALKANTKLVAVGQDNPQEFLKMAKKQGLAGHVIISKGRTDIPDLMQGADICVHPAYRENTGLVILEGMACATPMLVTESCGYASHVQTADAGLVSALPFNQTVFNAQFLQMRAATEAQKSAWSAHGLHYAQQLMQANDGSAEAHILIKLCRQKIDKKVLA